MRRFSPLLVLFLAGCTVNVNQPNLAANTAVAVGDGAQAVAPAPGASAAPGAAPAAPADPAGVTKDQEALKTAIAVEASRNSRVGQTFVAAGGKPLAAIGLRVAYKGDRAPDAVLKLYATDGGGPKGDPLATAAIPAADIGTNRDAAWLVARFAEPVALTAGAKYAWVLEVTGATAVVVGAGDNRTYEAGEGWTSSGSGTVWTRNGMDFAFRTYLA